MFQWLMAKKICKEIYKSNYGSLFEKLHFEHSGYGDSPFYHTCLKEVISYAG